MLNWIASLILAIALLALANLFEHALGNLSAWPYAMAFIAWLLIGYVLHTEGEFAEDVAEPAADQKPDRAPAEATAAPGTTTGTEEAVRQLVKELALKEEQIGKLHAKISEKEFRRSLSRMASISETLHFTLKLRDDGRIGDANALDQLRMEIESAISDLGLEFDAIVPGQTVAELTAGSFVVVRAEEAPPGGKPGTVKEVLNLGLFAKDELGKKHFISPSKINVYKLWPTSSASI